MTLDEPTTALGDKVCRRFFEIVGDLKNEGISVIFISHRPEELLSITDCITVMRDGQWITENDVSPTPETISQNPQQMGYLAVETPVKFAKGETVEEIVVPGKCYSKENIGK